MKKLIILLILSLFAFVSYGQLRVTKGIILGPKNSTTVVKIDSVSFVDNELKFYRAGLNLLPASGSAEVDSSEYATQYDISELPWIMGQLGDTLEGTDIIYLKSETYSQDQVDSVAALKANIASPTFTTRINITPTYTANFFLGNGGANLVSKAGDLSKYNTALGIDAFRDSDSGYYNTALGYYSMGMQDYGYRNTAIGSWSMAESEGAYNNCATGYNALYKTTGNGNSSIGAYSMNLTTTGSQNSVLGGRALYTNVSGNTNTVLGYEAGYLATGSGNVFLGASSGYRETGSNVFMVANSLFTTEAEGRTKSLLYGGFNATTANQFLTINAGTVSISNLPTYADNTAALAGGLVAGNLYKTSTGVLMITY